MTSTTAASSGSSTTSSSATATCTTAIPDKNGYVPPDSCNAAFDYYPSLAAAVVFSIVFGVLTIAHLAQGISYRKKFTWVIIMGALWETAAFILRAIDTRHQQSDTIEFISQILLLLAPLWVNAFDYMVLGRLVYFFLPEQSLAKVRATRFSVIFVWLDVVSFLVQATGGIMVSGTNIPAHTLTLGKNIYMAGIGLQQFFIVCFLALAITFHRRVLYLDHQGVLASNGKPGWRRLLYTLYASLLLISTRIIYRLVEYSGGFTSSNPIPTHEAYMYCLDALPMALALFIMSLSHPGQTLVGPDSEFPKLSRREKKAAKRARKEEKKERYVMKKLDRNPASESSMGSREWLAVPGNEMGYKGVGGVEDV